MMVIFTDRAGMATEEILRTYNSKSMIEEDFKWMEDKVVIPLWPFYVRKDLTVRAHVSLVLLGLMLYRLVQHDLGKYSMYLSTPVTYLDEIHVALVREGKRKPRFIVGEMDRAAAMLFSKLDMAKYVPGQFFSRLAPHSRAHWLISNLQRPVNDGVSGPFHGPGVCWNGGTVGVLDGQAWDIGSSIGLRSALTRQTGLKRNIGTSLLYSRYPFPNFSLHSFSSMKMTNRTAQVHWLTIITRSVTQ
jgi:hypothetical protein